MDYSCQVYNTSNVYYDPRESLKVHAFEPKRRSFHPKCYISLRERTSNTKAFPLNADLISTSNVVMWYPNPLELVLEFGWDLGSVALDDA